MGMMRHITAILIGWIGGASVSIVIDPIASFADNLGLLALWPVGMMIGHHSVLLSALLVLALGQFALVMLLEKNVPPLLRPGSTLILFALASSVGAMNLISVGWQI